LDWTPRGRARKSGKEGGEVRTNCVCVLGRGVRGVGGGGGVGGGPDIRVNVAREGILRKA